MEVMTLKQHRLIRELSKGQMAELLGIHVNTYTKWEEEPWKISIEDAARICNIFKIQFSHIIFMPNNETKCFK